MVTSLSTDKAVWEAMMNNEVVKGIRESLTKGQYKVTRSFSDSIL